MIFVCTPRCENQRDIERSGSAVYPMQGFAIMTGSHVENVIPAIEHEWPLFYRTRTVVILQYLIHENEFCTEISHRLHKHQRYCAIIDGNTNRLKLINI